jgi:anaerobic selenocysteine-containing dehydrogenase
VDESNDVLTRTVHTYCRVCHAQCGLLVDVADQQVVRVVGDPDHAVSRGYTCSKGRSLGAIHHAPDRLEFPMLNGARVEWETLLADLAGRLNGLVERHGPDSIACYRSAGWAWDCNARSMIDRWIRAIGTQQIYSPMTIDTPNRLIVPDLVAGAPFLQPVVDWEETKLLVLLGHNVVVYGRSRRAEELSSSLIRE